MGRLVADLDARPPHLGQAARHHRHGPDRPGGGAPRPRLRPVDPLSQPPPRRRRRSRRSWSATYWESLDQMLARMDIVSVNCPHTPATYHLLSARRLKLMRPEAYIVNTARGEVIDEKALVAADRGRRDRRRRPRRVRARAGGEPEAASSSRAPARWCCCRTWARPRSKAASTWARRSSSTSGPSWTATSRRTACCRRCCDVVRRCRRALAAAVDAGMSCSDSHVELQADGGHSDAYPRSLAGVAVDCRDRVAAQR